MVFRNSRSLTPQIIALAMICSGRDDRVFKLVGDDRVFAPDDKVVAGSFGFVRAGSGVR
jgi:hypothetical protein